MRVIARFALLAALAATIAGARDANGLLSTIITPNEGVPAIVLPGHTFDAMLEAKGDLELRAGDIALPLTVTWLPLPGNRHLARCTVSADTPVGTYTFAYANNGQIDTTVRAVWVTDEFPEVYTIAHLTDTHVGSDRHPRPSQAIFADMIQYVNESDAAFAIITGDLTENGKAGQFQDFLKGLNTCTKPTFVCAGNHDREDQNYEAAMGPVVYWFTFGKDAYLAFDTKDFNVAEELDDQDAKLQIYRQDMMPARWRIGITHRYDADMGMRSQLILFVDAPLDHLIYGHWHHANKTNVEAMPWPGVTATVTPAAINGEMRMFNIGRDVEGEGIQPGPVVQVTSVGTGEKKQ